MNANELADWLETGEVEEYDINEAATMLRQQQAEIEALKLENSQLKNRTIWDKPRESQYVKNVRLATESGEEG